MPQNNYDAVKEIIHQIEQMKTKQQYIDAIKYIHTHLVEHVDDYRLYEELCDIYIYMGKYDKAKSTIDFALSLNPQSATGNYLKGFVLISQDHIDAAIEYLETSNMLFHNNAEVLRNLGWAYTMTGKTDRGITILKRALNISPNDTLITEDLAMALISAGSIVEGNKLLKKTQQDT